HHQRSIHVLNRPGDRVGHSIFERPGFLNGGPLQIDQLRKNQVRLRSQRVGLAKTDVVLQEQGGGRIQQNVPLIGKELFQFRKPILASQQPLLFERAESLLLSPRLQHERRRQVVQQFGREQNPH